MYFETGQGSALSAEAHHGVDQQTMEVRAYAVARAYQPLLVNTVVGFIGPEYLYDGKQTYSASFTVFGPMRATLFLGQLYVIVNSIEQIRKLTDRFDDLIRIASVHPHEIPDFLRQLLRGCNEPMQRQVSP